MQGCLLHVVLQFQINFNEYITFIHSMKDCVVLQFQINFNEYIMFIHSMKDCVEATVYLVTALALAVDHVSTAKTQIIASMINRRDLN